MEEEKKRRPRLRTNDSLEERNENGTTPTNMQTEGNSEWQGEKTVYRNQSEERINRSFDARRDQYRSHYDHRNERPRDYDHDERNFNRPDTFNREGNYGRDQLFSRRDNRGNSNRGYNNQQGGYNRPERPSGGYDNRSGYHRDDRSYSSNYNRSERPSGGYNNRDGYSRDERSSGGNYNRPERPFGGYDNRGGYNRDDRSSGGGYNRSERPPGGYNNRGGYSRDDRYSGGGFDKRGGYQRGGGRDFNRGEGRGGFNRGGGRKQRPLEYELPDPMAPKPSLPSGEGMQLNKYLAHCGLASRRKAVDFIEAGEITVNGVVVKEPFYRVAEGDVVLHNGKSTQVQERKVVVLFNKPKNVITTADDEHGRATVMQFIDPHFPERLYPVGRLDRDTTGLIVITNDGELAQKLSHPSGKIYKQYRVSLDRPLHPNDMDKILAGFDLEDGAFQVNWARRSADGPPTNVELEIVIGRNRIVRRIFETLGYKVKALDRFYYGGLTKKNLPRGQFRVLTDKEVIMLRHFSTHIPRDADMTTTEAVED